MGKAAHNGRDLKVALRANNYDCGLMGALQVECNPPAVEKATWSEVKSLF